MTIFAGYYHRNLLSERDGDIVIIRDPLADVDQMDLRLLDEGFVLECAREAGVHACRLLERHGETLTISYIEGNLLAQCAPDHSPLPGHVLGDITGALKALDRVDVTGITSALWPEGEDWPTGCDNAGFHAKLVSWARALYNEHIDIVGDLFEEVGLTGDIWAPFDEDSRQLEERELVLVHGDLHRANLVLDYFTDTVPEDGQPHTGIIDWELALVGDRAYDLAVLCERGKLVARDQWQVFDIGVTEFGIPVRDIARYRELEASKSVVVDAIRHSRTIDWRPEDLEALTRDLARKLGLLLERHGKTSVDSDAVARWIVTH